MRLGVFTLSAAMAGFGGALYGGTLGAVGPQNLAFVQSLPLLLLGVVGGIGTAAGALVAGVLIGGLPLLVDAAPWFENVNRVLPGTMGIALGRNPNGIAYALRQAVAPLRRRPPATADLETPAPVGSAADTVPLEHDVQLVMRTCARVHVLDFGRVLASGTPAEIQADRAVLDAYLGAAPVGAT